MHAERGTLCIHCGFLGDFQEKWHKRGNVVHINCSVDGLFQMISPCINIGKDRSDNGVPAADTH